MTFRSLIPLLLFVLVLAGCGGAELKSPSQDQLQQYVSENPSELSSDADVDGGQTAN
ncbi:hypothetical protein [Stieleria varia]|uniref:Uncharacterized protein n=1 Tax=Stieleria varia TaxID=2528005 RepID=A0A5C6B7L5_9BACT|nr:hypothetical protein [Stieleria varia]TWU07797.1 hypothetical protein Pla52n_03720 [Stieleria varia]